MNVVMWDLKQGKREVTMFLIGIHVESWGRNHGMLLILDKWDENQYVAATSELWVIPTSLLLVQASSSPAADNHDHLIVLRIRLILVRLGVSQLILS
jgi:hypothetical protein